MATPTFSQSISDFRTMASGISTRQASLTGVGITTDDALLMETFATKLDKLNSEQEELKAKLKAKTDELNVTMKAAKAKNADLSKRVKIVTTQDQWVAFGITAKR